MQDEAMYVSRSTPQGAHYYHVVLHCAFRREHGIYGTPGYSVPDQQLLYPDGQRTLAF